MENKLKMRISSLFRSCKSKKINTDVFQQPVYYFANHHQHRQLVEIFSPKHLSFGSVNIVGEEPESPESFPPTHQSSCTAIRTKLCGGRRRDLHHHHHFSQVTDVESQLCPHALPNSTITTQNFRPNEKVEKSKRSKKVRSRSSRSFRMGINYFEFPVCNLNGLFSSDEDEDDDDDKTTFFSSKSLSSDSSDLLLRRTKDRRRRRSKKTANQKKKKKNDRRTCPLPEDGFAVVKRSKDPYSDFMSSMIEMITEKQIFAADELEKLLHRFLSLNSDHHHRIIIQVFKDVWDALFTNY